MGPPSVAGDGHTYEREAIAKWLNDKAVSPSTNQKLPDTRLIPNHNLRGAVMSKLDKLRLEHASKKRRDE